MSEIITGLSGLNGRIAGILHLLGAGLGDSEIHLLDLHNRVKSAFCVTHGILHNTIIFLNNVHFAGKSRFL